MDEKPKEMKKKEMGESDLRALAQLMSSTPENLTLDKLVELFSEKINGVKTHVGPLKYTRRQPMIMIQTGAISCEGNWV